MKRQQSNDNITSLYQQFQTHNKVKNLSEKTIDYYYWNLKPFINYLSSKHIISISKVNSSIVDNYILFQKEKYSNTTSINTRLRAVRAFLYWCMDNGYLKPFKIHLLKQKEEPLKLYSDDDIQKLIAKPNLKECSFVEYRDWVLVNYFVETGNRLRSVINIKVSDVDFSSYKVIIRETKNKEILITPLTKTLLNILPPYIRTWGLKAEQYLFPDVKGNQLTENAAKHTISVYNRKHGVSITSIHAFRHTFARNYIVTGGNTFKLQSLLGHKDLTMTRHYVHLFGEDLASDIDEHSIVERIKPMSNRLTKSKRHL